MTPKKFYDWQTAGGTDDVMRLVDCLERAEISWCMIGDLAVNHWAKKPMVTQDVDLIIAADSIDMAVQILEAAGVRSKRFAWSINFQGASKLSIQVLPKIAKSSCRQGCPIQKPPAGKSFRTHVSRSSIN